MTVESGPARTDPIWQLARSAVFVGFALYFLYDGLYGYPAKNRARAIETLNSAPFRGKIAFETLGGVPDEADYNRLRKLQVTTREGLYQALGQPTFTDGATNYFVSRYGFIRAAASGELTWQKWDKTKGEITGQFGWALVPAVLALPFLWKLYKATTLRVSVDGQALTYAGRRIPLADIVSLRGYSPKGWIDLYYRAGEKEIKLRLDNEKIARFDEVVEALCQAKGFHNEVKAYAERKAREEAAEAADPEGPEPEERDVSNDQNEPEDR